MSKFILPGASDRTVVIGPTGSGKTVGAAWILSRQRFDRRPWVCLDFKREELWDMVGSPPMRELRMGQMPDKVGLHRLAVLPNVDDDALEDWLWKIWARENVGIFVDEVSLMPRKAAFKAILRQGRSKRIPVIACTQRPVDCEREVFSESQFRMFYGIEDLRDWDVIKGLFRYGDVTRALPPFWSYWYDAKRKSCVVLRPVPKPEDVAKSLRDVAPRKFFLTG
jgi:hypothetical protein